MAFYRIEQETRQGLSCVTSTFSIGARRSHLSPGHNNCDPPHFLKCFLLLDKFRLPLVFFFLSGCFVFGPCLLWTLVYVNTRRKKQTNVDKMAHSSAANYTARPGQRNNLNVMDIRYISPNAGAVNPPAYNVSTASRPPTSPYAYNTNSAASNNGSTLNMRGLGEALPQSRPNYSVSYAPQIASPPVLPPNSSYAAASSSSNTPRAPRPSYSEEQKFYIMYARIIRDWSWPEIEANFTRIFDGRSDERGGQSGTQQQRAANHAAQRNERSKGGLTSVYYRIRRSWGLEEVLKGGPETFANDKRVIHHMARNFSEEFLVSIGYLG